MTHCSISYWTTEDWTDEMEALARSKYVPASLALGASSVRMVRTGDKSFSVIAEYADTATAEAAQEKAAALRAQAAEELPMTLQSVASGPVFAQG